MRYPQGTDPTVVRLSVEETTNRTCYLEDTSRRRASNLNHCFDESLEEKYFFKRSDPSSSWKNLEVSGAEYSSNTGCFSIINVLERHEGCYMFIAQDFSGVYLKQIQLADVTVRLKVNAIYCVENPMVSGLNFRLEHMYNGKTIRYVEGEGIATLSLLMLPIPYHNNGIYQCISYADNNKSIISQNKSLVFEYKGLPVFAESNRIFLRQESKKNTSVTLLVYSYPNITDIEVVGQGKSTDSFIIHQIDNNPTLLDGWNSPGVKIPGWKISIDIEFQKPQNITLGIMVKNKIGNNTFKIKAIIEGTAIPETLYRYSFMTVVTCFMGILLVCIFTLITAPFFILNRRTTSMVDIESPYTYDEIGTIDNRSNNVPSLFTVVSSVNTRRTEHDQGVICDISFHHNKRETNHTTLFPNNMLSGIGTEETQQALVPDIDINISDHASAVAMMRESSDMTTDNTDGKQATAEQYINLQIW